MFSIPEGYGMPDLARNTHGKTAKAQNLPWMTQVLGDKQANGSGNTRLGDVHPQIHKHHLPTDENLPTFNYDCYLLLLPGAALTACLLLLPGAALTACRSS